MLNRITPLKTWGALLLVFAWLGSAKAQTSTSPPADAAAASPAINLVDLEKRIAKLEEKTNSWVLYGGALLGGLALAFSVGAGAWVRSKVREMAVQQLAQELKLDQNALKEMLRSGAAEYQAKQETYLLVVSEHADQNAKIRQLLIKGGFNLSNVSWASIEEEIALTGVDMVVFNDKLDSTLEVENMKRLILQYKRAVPLFFYFGPNDKIPLRDWRKELQVPIGAANFEDSFASGLLRTLTSHLSRPS